MSHRALGPMFHGTAHELAPGSDIVPGKEFGRSSFRHGGVGPRGKAHSESAFATTSEDAAWHFAQVSEHTHGGRARVHEVEPHPAMEPGLSNREHRTFARRSREDPDVARYADKWQEWAAPSFRPTGRTIDTMPGRQGTFPSLNWRQFSTSNYHDVNHPIPDEVEHGHTGSKLYMEAVYRNFSGPPKPEPQHPGQGRLF